jgi:hypothetical protein
VEHLRFADNGRALLSVSAGEIRVHRGPALAAVPELHTPVVAPAFRDVNPQTLRVEIADRGQLHSYDLEADPPTRVQTDNPHPDLASWQAIGRGRLVLARQATHRICILDPKSNVTYAELADPDRPPRAHDFGIDCVAVEPAGLFAASACDDENDHRIRFWNLACGRAKPAVRIPGNHPIRLAWSADGNILFATSANFLHRFLLKRPGLLSFHAQQDAFILAAEIDDTGAHLGLVTVGDHYPDKERAYAIAALPGPSAQFIWHGGYDQPRRWVEAHIGPIATWEQAAKSWPIEGSGVYVGGLNRPIKRLNFYEPEGITVAATGTHVWLNEDSHTLGTWDFQAPAWQPRWKYAEGQARGLPNIRVMQATKDHLILGARDGAVLMIDPATHQTRRRFPPTDAAINAIRATDSLAVAGSQNGTIRTFCLREMREWPALPNAHHEGITALALSRDGDWLLTGSRDHTVMWWQRTGETWTHYATLDRFPLAVRHVSITADGRHAMVLLQHERVIRWIDLAGLKESFRKMKLAP